MATYFVVGTDGKRRIRTFDEYSGGGLAKAMELRRPGETVEGPRQCPYYGCTCGPDARPPCALCYE